MPDQQHVNPVDQMAREAVLTEQVPTFDPVDCFKQMILARTINDVLKTRKTQGKFDFYIGCAGHEAIAGVIAALRPDDWLTLYYIGAIQQSPLPRPALLQRDRGAGTLLRRCGLRLQA